MEFLCVYLVWLRLLHMWQIASTCGYFEAKYSILSIKMKWKVSSNPFEE